MPSNRSTRRSHLLPALTLMLLALSVTACGSRPILVKPELFNRDPPPGEMVSDEACPPSVPMTSWPSDQAMFSWIRGELASGDLCRASWSKLRQWSLNPPKQEKVK